MQLILQKATLKLHLRYLSGFDRVGSGSACRSLNGGFVAWRMGKLSDGSDSLAEQIAPQSHWPQLKVLILVVSFKYPTGWKYTQNLIHV